MHWKTILPAGLFALLATALPAQNPCDTVQVVAQATATDLTCSNPVATLTGAVHPSALSYHWTGPGGFVSNMRVTQNFIKGTYTLTVTGLYGCTAQTSVVVKDLCTSVGLIPPACQPVYEDVVPADECYAACVMPFLPQNVTYNTGGYSPGFTPSGWCGTIENDQWFAFVGGTTGGLIAAIPSNCANGDGIQIGLFDNCGGNLIACNGGMQGGGDTPVSITLNNLNPGQVYYLAVDGYAGDVCDFTFEVLGNVCDSSTHPPVPPLEIFGDTLVCPYGTANYTAINLNSTIASAFLWTAPPDATVNGEFPPTLIYKPDGGFVTVNFGSTSGFVCMRPIYYFAPPGPPVCFQVNVEPIPPTILPDAIVCNEALPYELPWGDFVVASGTYSFNYTSEQGCDSLVKQKVIVKPPIITNLGIIKICAGECVVMDCFTSCDPGAYSVVLSSYLGCDSIVNFTLAVANPIAEILGGGTLTCSQPSIILNSAPSPGTKTWTNQAGQIVGTGNTLTVTQAGIYILKSTQVLSGLSCTQADTVAIDQDITAITANAQGGALTCSSPTITLFGNASDPQASLSWTGPNGFSASGAEITVNTPGNYTLLATLPNGCSDTDVAVVAADQGLPVVTASGGVLTCAQPSVLLSYTSSDPNAVITLFDPEGQPVQDPNVSVPGEYTVVATVQNGCSATALAEVESDQQAPSVAATAGMINCSSPTTSLNSTVSATAESLLWTGPGGFSTSEPDPEVTLPGDYILTATGFNGCQASAEVTVAADLQQPVVSVAADTINCDPDHVAYVFGYCDLDMAVFFWTGPGGYASNLPVSQVDAPGTYDLTVINPVNGCTAAASVEVYGTLNIPDLNVVQIPPACGDSLLLLDASSSTPGVSFHWTGPDGFYSDEEDPVVSTPGWYKVAAMTNNACENTINILVVSAPEVPQLSVSAGAFDCSLLPVPLVASSNLPADAYAWSGPGNFSSGEASPLAPQPGDYVLTFTASNGCTATASVTVGIDLSIPDLSATGGILTCEQPFVTIVASSSTPGAVINWLGGGFPTGQAAVVVTEPGTYEAVATSPNGCTATASVEVIDSCLTGVEQQLALLPAFRLYPNASTGLVFAEIQNAAGLDALNVYTVEGRLLLQEEFSSPKMLEQLDLTQQPAGAYWVSARAGARWFVERLILIR
ncbi:MAG TPA: T9SS type A sorting domain-containing protein [Saprospiraceae bacterium]|nr:T9SS type A sorting domain-containing protein [Saprospiraceae bacterium]